MSLAEREREIERTRERLGQTLGQIGDKLTVSGMVDEALGSGRLPVFEQSYGRALDIVRRNPLPVLLVAAGIGYVLTRMGRRERAARTRLADGSLADPPLADLPVVNDGRARTYDLDDEAGRAELGPTEGAAALSDRRKPMNELERHEAAANRTARDAHDAVEDTANRARSTIGEATTRAKDSLRQARATAESAYDDVSDQARGAYRRARNQVYGLRHYAPGSPEAARRGVADFVESNPAMVAVVGIAAGLLVGALLPGTRREDQLFGRYADDAKEEGLRYARDLVQQGRHYVERVSNRPDRPRTTPEPGAAAPDEAPSALNSPVRILAAGDTALVVEFGRDVDPDTNARVLALDGRLSAETGIVETVPTYRSLLVRYDSLAVEVDDLSRRLRDLAAMPLEPGADRGRTWIVPVAYGGPYGIDLDETAARHDITPDELIRRHAAPTYRVYMVGFLPGFAYLGGLDPSIATPRRTSPRLKTPAGTISIGGVQALVASLAAPSGWHLLGQTPVRNFMVGRDPAVLIGPGDRVRFRPIAHGDFAALETRAEAGEPVAEREPA